MTRENELLRKIEKGDASCWEELAAMYYDDILRYCLYHTRDRETAEDAVQEAFVRVAKHMENVGQPEETATKRYLITITKHAAIDLYRRRNRRNFRA